MNVSPVPAKMVEAALMNTYLILVIAPSCIMGQSANMVMHRIFSVSGEIQYKNWISYFSLFLCFTLVFPQNVHTVCLGHRSPLHGQPVMLISTIILTSSIHACISSKKLWSWMGERFALWWNCTCHLSLCLCPNKSYLIWSERDRETRTEILQIYFCSELGMNGNCTEGVTFCVLYLDAWFLIFQLFMLQVNKGLQTKVNRGSYGQIWGSFLPCFGSESPCAQSKQTIAVWIKVNVCDQGTILEIDGFNMTTGKYLSVSCSWNGGFLWVTLWSFVLFLQEPISSKISMLISIFETAKDCRNVWHEKSFVVSRFRVTLYHEQGELLLTTDMPSDWFHLALTITRLEFEEKLMLHINGAVVKSEMIRDSVPSPVQTDVISIGASVDGLNTTSVMVDELFIFNEKLAPDHIQLLFMYE